MRTWKHLLFFVLSLAGPNLVLSQTGLTSLRGTIIDPSGAVVVGAQVDMSNETIGFHSSRLTDAGGHYEFPQIAPGFYTITVKGKGFKEQSKRSDLLVSQPTAIDFALSVEGSQANIEVQSDAQGLNTTDASIGNAVNSATLEALPMEGRNVPDLLSLQPGVVYLGRQINQDQDSRSGAVSGGRSDQANLTLDGVDNNDQRQGYAFQGVLRSTLDSVEEFRVTTTSANADSGRSSGAQATLVTKGGSNTFHGALYEYNRNTATSANDWFNKAAEIDNGFANRAGSLIRNTFGVSLGGPIQRDRLFFFLNYEGQRTSENMQQALTVPTESFRQGSLSYFCSGASTCPANGIQTLSSAQIGSMDPGCSSQNPPTCPWGPGVDPNVLATLNAYPTPNSIGGDTLNTGGFTWSAPAPRRLNTYIARIDDAASANHRVFFRANLLGDRQSGPPQFPGNPQSAMLVNTSKGVAAGDLWTLGTSVVNSFRYGYVRQALNNLGGGNNSYADFAGISPLTAENTTTLLHVPLHNFVDDLTWVKGKHTIQFGANYRLLHNNTVSNSVAFNSATSGAGNIRNAAIAGTFQSLDPEAFGFPAVAGNFKFGYDNAVTDIAGLLPTINVHNNYDVTSSNSGALLPTGSMIPRSYKANEFEYYVQDSWRLKPNLTLTFGLRDTLLQTPYEVNGQQVAPTINLHDWFVSRGIAAAQGLGNQPEFAFAPSGQSRGGRAFWNSSKLNLAPRLAIAYSPKASAGIFRTLFGSAGKTAVRAGAGLYYDHFGEGIVDSFNQFGSFGLTSTESAPSNIFTPDNAPRYTARTSVPNVLTAALPMLTYPVFPSSNPYAGGFTYNSNGIDGDIKTPYSIVTDLSIQRQMRGWIVEADYVGRFGRHLLQQFDLAESTDLLDAKSGMDYFTAARLMSEFALAHGEATRDPNNSLLLIPPIQYFEDLFPTAAAGGFGATQNIYTGLSACPLSDSCFSWANRPGREAGAPFRLGLICSQLANGGVTPVCQGQPPVPFWDPQFASLFAWSSIGSSSYNAGQFILRHSMTRGLQLDFSYTFSKSLDLGSDTERTSPLGTTSTVSPLGLGTSTVSSYIANSWNPALNRAASDFDTRHVITGSWLYQLPFAINKTFAGDTGRVLGAFVSGWQFSGLTRWTSGFTFSVTDNIGYTTDYLFNTSMVQTAPVKAGLFRTAAGPSAFANPSLVAAATDIIPNVPAPLTPLRFPYPGEAGSRNNFRGPGYFRTDMALAKSCKIHENLSLKFAWEVFNVSNSVRFDVNTNTSLNNGIADGPAFGLYRKTLTAPRVQQFSLRFSF